MNQFIQFLLLSLVSLSICCCETFEPFEELPTQTNTPSSESKKPIIYYRNFTTGIAINEGSGSVSDRFTGYSIESSPIIANQYLRGAEDVFFFDNTYLRLDTLSAFTFSLWMRGPAGQREVFIQKLDSLDRFQGQLRIKDDRIRVDFTDLIDTERITGELLDNEWTMLTVVVDNVNSEQNNSTIRIFIDGTLLMTFTDQKTIFTGGKNYRFLSGIRNDIDEVLFYDYSISEQEIDSIFNSTEPQFEDMIENRPTYNHLFSYYDFDNNGPIDPVGGRDGISSNVQYSNLGVGDRGLSATFISQDFGGIEVSNSILQELYEFTFSFWIKVPDLRYNPILFQGTGDTTLSKGGLIRIADGEIFIGKEGPDGLYNFDYSLTEYLLSNDWTMITIGCERINVEDGVFGATLYINGVRVETTNETKISFDRRTSMFIGTDNNGTTFVGSLDNIRLYNKKLSSEEINEIYELER